MLHEFHLLTCILTFPPQSLTGWVLGFSIDAAPSARSLLVVVPPAVQLSVVPPSLSPTAPSARSPLDPHRPCPTKNVGEPEKKEIF